MYSSKKTCVILFVSLCLFLFSINIYAENVSKTDSSFTISQPPLGYPQYYDDGFNKRNRFNISYHNYDTSLYKLKGASISNNTRLLGGNRGALSLQYGGFYLTGNEDWGTDEKIDFTVYGFNVEPVVELLLFEKTDEKDRGVKIIPFLGFDGGFQFFKQTSSDFKDDYYSRFYGPSGGVQAHLGNFNKILFSPFIIIRHIRGTSVSDDADFNFTYTNIGYGFDVIWRGFSLSGLTQAPTGSSGRSYTISIGFSF